MSIKARQVWDRNAVRILSEGRLQTIDHELLAVFCETLGLYIRCRDDYPIGFHGYSDTLDQRRFWRSRRVSAKTGLFGHVETVIRPKRGAKSPALPMPDPGY